MGERHHKKYQGGLSHYRLRYCHITCWDIVTLYWLSFMFWRLSHYWLITWLSHYWLDGQPIMWHFVTLFIVVTLLVSVTLVVVTRLTMQLTTEQRVFLMTEWTHSGSLQQVAQAFRRRFPDRNVPAKSTIWKNVRKYQAEGTSLNWTRVGLVDQGQFERKTTSRQSNNN